MRIAHRNAGDRENFTADFQRGIDHRIAGQSRVAGKGGGNSGRLEDRLAHVDADAPHAAVGNFQFQVKTPRPVSILSGERRADAVVVNVLGHAADAVAAHFGLRAVGVEHPHPGVGHFAGADQNQTVAADAKMPIGHLAGQLGGIRRKRFFKTIDIHVVVAGSVHFGKTHGRDSDVNDQ